MPSVPVVNEVFNVLCDGKKHAVKELAERFGVDERRVRAMLRFGDEFEFLSFDASLDETWMCPAMSKAWRRLDDAEG